MRWRGVAVCLAVVLGLSPIFLQVSAGTPGTFRGVVVRPSEAGNSGWIYVLGRNGQVRRVDVSHSQVSYGDPVAQRDRRKSPRESLVPGSELRITAEPDEKGEWRAIQVEILRIGSDKKP
jgi:hypothetical protein